ncbi:MAG: hypothetical protein GEU75_03605 [Dehalococcoidia bacterium]|nr:hypothetical protein [Dehalococcoidia bacterium]
MTRPLVGSFHHIHTAIGGELLKLEEHARMVDPSNAESVGGFAGHLGMLEAIQETHSHEEENALWPKIEAKLPGATASFLFDHEAERRYFVEIKAALGEVQAGGDKQAAAARLYRTCVALSAHLTHHMAKEEAQPYSQFADAMTPEEEAKVIYGIYEGLPEEMVTQAMPWFASYQSPADIVDEAETLLTMARPEKARLMLNAVVKSLPPEKWAELEKLKPSLAEFR